MPHDHKYQDSNPVQRGDWVASLAEVFRILNEVRDEGIVTDYAIGGAMAVLFYAEPTRTYDLDVFVLLPPGGSPLAQLSPIYDWAEKRGYPTDAEHLIIHGVPVQFLPAYNDLVEEAVRTARALDYEDVPVRVIAPEYLAALALQAGGVKRRERIAQLLEAEVINRDQLADLLSRHDLDETWQRYWGRLGNE
jgi:hypothetical protein